jgi:hypothetical protein
MSKESLLKLHSLLKPLLEVSTRKFRGDTIPSLAKVMMTLRYLAGSRWVDIVRIHGVSKPALYFCIQQVIRAIIRHPLVGKPKFPTDEVKAKEYAEQWASLSGPPGGRRGVLSGCIGAIDGILIKTKAPTKKETVRVTDFYSGHKKQWVSMFKLFVMQRSELSLFLFFVQGRQMTLSHMNPPKLHLSLRDCRRGTMQWVTMPM